MNNFAGEVLNSTIGPLLRQLIFNPSQSTSLQSKIDSLPKTKFPLYEGSYPTYPGSGEVHDGKGSYPQLDVFEDGPSRYPEDRIWGIPKISNIKTMEFRDRNNNGIEDRDEQLGMGRLQQIDPIVQDALDRIESERRAGIAGTFLPVQY